MTIYQRDVYASIEARGMTPRTQGWENSVSPILAGMAAKAQTIIEVGSWLGLSAITMAQASPEARIYCVDTWLGSPEITDQENKRDAWGHPTAYWQFLTNIKAEGLHDRVIPILWPSITGARILGKMGITADLIYIDADHSYEGCFGDLCAFAPLLNPGGTIIGDDLRNFPGVLPAAVRFAYEFRFTLREEGNFFVMQRRE